MAKRTVKTQNGCVKRLPSGRFKGIVKFQGVTYYSPGVFDFHWEAVEWNSSTKAALRRGVLPLAHNGGETLDAILELFLSSRTVAGRPIRKSTAEHYRNLSRRYMTRFMQLTPAEVTFSQVFDWHSSLISTGKLTSAAKAYKLLKTLMNFAVDMGLVSSNPCRIRGAQSGTTGKPDKIPSFQEGMAISAALPPQFYALGLLMLYGGLRFGEVTALTVGDVHMSKPGESPQVWLDVNKAYSFVAGAHVLGQPKSKAGKRVIFLHRDLAAPLRHHINLHTEGLTESLLFSRPSGLPIRHDSFMKAWNRALVSNGLENKGITPHSFRRFAATMLVENGANLAELKNFLGDATSAVAIGYLRDRGEGSTLADRFPSPTCG